VRETVADERVYPTPKVDVRAVVFQGGKILLVLEKSTGRWTLPGGWADIGDAPSEAAAREAFEEAGYHVRPVKLLAVFDKSRHGHPRGLLYIYKLFIRCELIGGEPTDNHETSSAAFFGLDELPPLDAHRVTEDQIQRLFAHLADPNLPADFD
jgi:ADP-ribose pyrophosphatase YjhB (NUDIX family)